MTEILRDIYYLVLYWFDIKSGNIGLKYCTLLISPEYRFNSPLGSGRNPNQAEKLELLFPVLSSPLTIMVHDRRI